ncbi:MAG: cytochrome c [Bacteroidota bacterium]
MKFKLFLTVALLSLLYACGVKSAQKSQEKDQKLTAATATVSPELMKGHELYQTNCSKCHPAFEVKSKPVERWQQVLEPMIKFKAKMSEEDGKLVSAYVWNELGGMPGK